jgi:hypothetical protein
MVRLIQSPAYQQLWGDRFQMVKTGERRIENNQTGFKMATSVGGVSTGERGDRVILDDPHNVIKAESDLEREKTVRFVRESMSNRLNDEQSAIVVIMQRLHEGDVSGEYGSHVLRPVAVPRQRRRRGHRGPRDGRGL